MLKSVLFTHDDLDGAGCRVLYELAHWHMQKGRDYMVFNCTNQNLDDTVLQMLETKTMNARTEICFADIAPVRDVMDQLVNRFNVVRVWDHHLTRQWIREYPNVILVHENELGIMQSGTSLLYQWYCGYAFQHPSDPGSRYFTRNGNQVLLGKFVDAVRSYDTYEWKDTGTIMPKKLQMLFFLLNMDKFCRRFINRIQKDLQNNDLILPHDMEFVDSKLEFERQTIEKFNPDTVYTIDVRGYKTALVLYAAGANVSELGSQFLLKYPEYDMFISFSFARGGQFSIRTRREDLDTGRDIAGLIGGGGHAKSSGASITPECLNHIVKVLWRQLNRHGQAPQKEVIEDISDIKGPTL